jgi:predicted permease
MDDVRFALRQFRKSAGFTIIAVFTLALGIAASLAIFAFVDAALLTPLPFPQSARLAGVFESVPMFPRSNLSYQDYLDWKRLNTVFSSLSAYQGSGAMLTTPAGPERVSAARVSDDFFKTLGVTPVVGRDFRAGEDLPSAAATVIISHNEWQSRFGGRREALGQAVTLNGVAREVIGVMPAGFAFAPVAPTDYWLPLQPLASACEARRSCHNLYGVARLRDGVSIAAAAANIASIASALEQQYPDSNRGQGSVVVPLSDVIVGRVRPILLTLAGGAALLLLIAAVNVAGLVLVRAEGRRREIAVRGALGASRWRIVRHFVAEGIVLVAASCVIGVAGAIAAIRLLRALIPADVVPRLPFLGAAGLHLHAWLAVAGVAVLAVALLSLLPLMQLSSEENTQALAEGSRGSAGLAWRRLGSRLVVVELAVAMVLLAGGVLLARSLYQVLRIDLGMRPDHLVMMAVNAPISVNDEARRIAFQRRVLERVRALPGVIAAGTTTTRPLQGGNTNWIRVEGRPYHGEHNEVNWRGIDEGYFDTIGARLLRGRPVLRTDEPSTPLVVVINRAFERQYFPGEDPIGHRILYAPTARTPPMEIVGVVDDIKENALDAITPPTMYTAVAQDANSGFWMFVRTSQSEQSMLPTLSTAIREIDPGIATFAGRDVTSWIEASEPAYLRRSAAWVVGGFAALAWLLGIVGLYGVVAYSVGRRTREIGVRMALGAQRGSVSRLIVGEAGRLVVFGIVAGTIAAIGAAASMRTLLFGVTPWDAPTLSAVAIVLGVSALVASYVPARRAASLNPVEALRAE